MFYGTFSNFARRTATFKVGNTTAATQTFTYPYSTKNTTTDNTPSTNPTVNAGDVVIPTYNATTRSITKPTGTYANYNWYTTDGTSCSVSSPTPDCGVQNSSTLVTLPNTTEWIPDTSTEKGNVVFYGALPATITFNSNGGSTVEDQTVNLGDTVTEPTDPTRDHYTFDHWYICTDVMLAAYDFTTPVSSDISLCAKWTIDKQDVQFVDNGTTISEIEVEYGNTITEPETPTREGYQFSGWYEDESLTTEFNFNELIVDNLTIYAKWDKLCEYDSSVLEGDNSCSLPCKYNNKILSNDINCVLPANDPSDSDNSPTPTSSNPTVPGTPNTGVRIGEISTASIVL
jgi:uncharacterized repeat protein (TIGR02543 family)